MYVAAYIGLASGGQPEPPDRVAAYYFSGNDIIGRNPMTSDNQINSIRTNLYDTQKQLRHAMPDQRKELLKICRNLNLELSRANYSPRIDYHKYIKSKVWKNKAVAAKERVSYRCQICNACGNNSTLHAHHRTYDNLGNEPPEDITVLCADCHKTFHEKGQVNGE